MFENVHNEMLRGKKKKPGRLIQILFGGTSTWYFLARVEIQMTQKCLVSPVLLGFIIGMFVGHTGT